MVNKNIKRHPTLLTMREMKNQTHSEITLNTHKDGLNKKKRQVLTRMWRNCNLHTQLVRMKNGSGLENSSVVPLKIKCIVII
jgi:hypothetical protein